MTAQDSLEPDKRQPRVVLLGASNLTRGISTAVETSQLFWQQPVSIYIAAGHGRSYGQRSRVLGRELPGIIDCGLWSDLRASTPAPTTALLTDIGNDLIYGCSVDVVFRWIKTCVERLSGPDTTITLTGLPLEGIRNRPRWHFELLSRVFFPSRNVSLQSVIERAHELDERLEQFATERNLVRVIPQRNWYGWDPIHIKLAKWPVAWQEILSAWKNSEKIFPLASGSLTRWGYLRRLRPAERVWLGRKQIQTQPCGKLPDGSTVSLY